MATYDLTRAELDATLSDHIDPFALQALDRALDSNEVTEPVRLAVGDIPTPRGTDVFLYDGPADATFSRSDFAPDVTGYIFDTNGDITATIGGGDGGGNQGGGNGDGDQNGGNGGNGDDNQGGNDNGANQGGGNNDGVLAAGSAEASDQSDDDQSGDDESRGDDDGNQNGGNGEGGNGEGGNGEGGNGEGGNGEGGNGEGGNGGDDGGSQKVVVTGGGNDQIQINGSIATIGCS